ncbi:MAG: SIR2 family protein [Phycisphaerales bacterium]|nr:SIR2 family protein [Phycisphaerales bacterium]
MEPTASDRDGPCDSILRTAYIADGDVGFSAIVEELVGGLKERHVVPLLGAGISDPPPSCMPLGAALEARLRRALWASVDAFLKERPLCEADRSSAERILKEARLERMLDVLQQTHGPAPVHEFLSVLRGTDWNCNHAALGALSKAERLPLCITLNFDLLIEYAVAASGGVAETVCPLRDFARFSVPTSPDAACLQIIKPHGSLAPNGSGMGEFALLSPTLADVGNQPDPRNEAAITRALSDGSILLVAGYSDHDWDIFPVVQAAAAKSSHVYWVEYLVPEGVARKEQPSGDAFDRVCGWLQELDGKGTLLLGDPSLLLKRVCDRLRVPFDSRDGHPRVRKEAPTDQFLSGTREVLATSVALALLLQDRGRVHHELVHWLLSQDRVGPYPSLGARLHRSAAHSCHTQRDLRQALRHMRACTALRRQQPSDDSHGGSVADDLVWMGYEHLCMIKRPSVRWVALIPALWHWYHGVRLLRAGVLNARRVSGRQRRKLRAMIRFYRGDLLHSWAALAFLVGGPGRGLGRALCRRASRWYSKARQIDSMSMDWEYYWMRRLEAQLLGGAECDEKDTIIRKLEHIEWSYGILQNHVQRGNTLAYRALVTRGSDTEKLLSEAEVIWSAEDGFVPSGLMRVVLFRRVLGVRGFFETIRDLWTLRQKTRVMQRGR